MLPKIVPLAAPRSIRAALCSSRLRYTGRAHISCSSSLFSDRGKQIPGALPSYHSVGVTKVLDTSTPTEGQTAPTLFTHEFSLADRVALVSGGGRGIGLEMALALIEAGARSVYCLDLPTAPSEEWTKVLEHVQRMKRPDGSAGVMVYVSADVRDQEKMWKVGEMIGEREGRMDVCVAAAGILRGDASCLDYPEQRFREVIDVNVNGVLFTAQAAGQQMKRFGNGGSIIMIASISGHGTNIGHPWVSYNTSKSAVLQMARSMACELAPQGIRVNTISPGYINTSMTGQFLAKRPELLKVWSSHNPMGRIGRPDELRGVVAWLASDASSFCTGTDVLVSGGHHAW